jgi:hypothetical protein
MDLAGLPEALAGVWTLAKEIGKGGGGSTEDPTVCIVLLPIGVGVLAVGLQRLRRGILGAPGGRTAALGVEFEKAPERKVQTA